MPMKFGLSQGRNRVLYRRSSTIAAKPGQRRHFLAMRPGCFIKSLQAVPLGLPLRQKRVWIVPYVPALTYVRLAGKLYLFL
jgi:hypothetical protein